MTKSGIYSEERYDRFLNQNTHKTQTCIETKVICMIHNVSIHSRCLANEEITLHCLRYCAEVVWIWEILDKRNVAFFSEMSFEF
jgi:hypothetical protein